MNKLVIIVILFVLASCGQSTKSDKEQIKLTEIETAETKYESGIERKSVNFECSDFSFSTAREQSDSLLVFMERAKSLNSINRQIWEHKFFCAFPGSFERMQAVFGYDSEKGAAPLYEKGQNVIQYFINLESIPDSIYFGKCVRINIDGVWEADNIAEAFGFSHRLLKNTDNACKALSKFSYKEIESVFRFIFDGPHPKNDYNENLYKNLITKIDIQDNRLSRLLTQAYENLMAEDNGHGH
jgi:hypothetical protein